MRSCVTTSGRLAPESRYDCIRGDRSHLAVGLWPAAFGLGAADKAYGTSTAETEINVSLKIARRMTYDVAQVGHVSPKSLETSEGLVRRVIGSKARGSQSP